MANLYRPTQEDLNKVHGSVMARQNKWLQNVYGSGGSSISSKRKQRLQGAINQYKYRRSPKGLSERARLAPSNAWTPEQFREALLQIKQNKHDEENEMKRFGRALSPENRESYKRRLLRLQGVPHNKLPPRRNFTGNTRPQARKPKARQSPLYPQHRWGPEDFQRAFRNAWVARAIREGPKTGYSLKGRFLANVGQEKNVHKQRVLSSAYHRLNGLAKNPYYAPGLQTVREE